MLKIKLNINLCTYRNLGLDSSLGIATGYGLDGKELEIDSRQGMWFLSFPQRPDRLWGSPSLLANGYRGVFPTNYIIYYYNSIISAYNSFSFYTTYTYIFKILDSYVGKYGGFGLLGCDTE
jgi:hypothetical protein